MLLTVLFPRQGAETKVLSWSPLAQHLLHTWKEHPERTQRETMWLGGRDRLLFFPPYSGTSGYMVGLLQRLTSLASPHRLQLWGYTYMSVCMEGPKGWNPLPVPRQEHFHSTHLPAEDFCGSMPKSTVAKILRMQTSEPRRSRVQMLTLPQASHLIQLSLSDFTHKMEIRIVGTTTTNIVCCDDSLLDLGNGLGIGHGT